EPDSARVQRTRKWIETDPKVILLSEILRVLSIIGSFNPHSSQKELFLLPSVVASLPPGLLTFNRHSAQGRTRVYRARRRHRTETVRRSESAKVFHEYNIAAYIVYLRVNQPSSIRGKTKSIRERFIQSRDLSYPARRKVEE